MVNEGRRALVSKGTTVTEQMTASEDAGSEPTATRAMDPAANAALMDEELLLAASREHRKRARKQVQSAILIVTLIAVAPTMRELLSDILNGNPYSPLFSKLIPAGKVPPVTGYLNYSFFLIWLVYLGYLQWYLRERGKDWRENVQQANSSDPEECARGYMAVFRMYARTKRRATFTMIWGVSALYVGGWGIVLGIQSGENLMLLSSSLEIALGSAVILFGVFIGQRFLPGKVLIGHTLKLSIRAAASNTALMDAQGEAESIETELKQDKPWWYY